MRRSEHASGWFRYSSEPIDVTKDGRELAGQSAKLLRSNMHGAMRSFAQHMAGELEPKVASVCKSEELTLLPRGLDFSEIRTYRPSDYPGIIILRPRTQSQPAVLGLVEKFPPHLDGSEKRIGHLWIV